MPASSTRFEAWRGPSARECTGVREEAQIVNLGFNDFVQLGGCVM